MPGYRGKRGGSRTGQVGKAYPQRSDLNGDKPLPVQAPTGGQYGSAKASMDAQRAVPMAGAPAGAAAPQGAMPAPPAGMPNPDQLPSLFDPSTDPDEDVMSGAAIGPGPGPDAFGFGPQAQDQRDNAWVQRYLPAMEFAANSAKGGDAARQVVRMLKAKTGLGLDR